MYVSVLCTIALLALLGQIMMQIEIQQHMNDAHIIDVASRQCMLSQKLSKTVLEIVISATATDRASHVSDLKGVLVEWQRAHYGLQHGDARLSLSSKNSPEVTQLFQTITPSFTTIMNASEQVARVASQKQTAGSNVHSDALSAFVHTILITEPEFLRIMERIVARYEQEAVQHMASVQVTALVLFLVTLCVLLFEGILVFRPTIARIANDVTQIMHLEERAAYMTEVQRRSQAHEQALYESLNALVRLRYPIQILALGQYQVQDEQERTYLVTAEKHHEGELLRCECELYERTSSCSHFVAASSLHASLLVYSNKCQ
jgi:hypothetical protein